MVRNSHFIDKFVAHLPRSPLQLNKMHECDCEIISLHETSTLLCLTTDSLIEEIQVGLYTDPLEIGYMAILVCLSDLYAAGATPIGFLLTENLPVSIGDSFIRKLHKGIDKACRISQAAILGGDTNFGEQLNIAVTGVGTIKDGKVLQRKGCSPGEILYASGSLGHGNRIAFERLVERKRNSMIYEPPIRSIESGIIRKFATSCIDTSDGFIPTVAEIMRVNAVGISLDSPLECFVDSVTCEVARNNGIPPWLMLAGPHGEFELLFTVKTEDEFGLTEAASLAGWAPKKLGQIINGQKLISDQETLPRQIDVERVSNLYAECAGDLTKYIENLLMIARG
jgi:thiamine-monophosphate kinase